MRDLKDDKTSVMASRKRKSTEVLFTNDEPNSKRTGLCLNDQSQATNGNGSNSVSNGQPVIEEDTDWDIPATQQSCVSETGQSSMSADTIAQMLDGIGQCEAAEKFRDENITGAVLDMITEETLTKMGINKIGDQLEVLQLIRRISDQHQKKVFNDSVHGHIELHPLCVKIVDTPQFQRLRYLKQLGACYFVYPGAAHNRFEHCIGVCHLAGQLAQNLKERQPELDITNKDVLCVEMAGLCHDLGHGPFSHMFDGKFMPTARPDIKWKHEDGSVTMFDHMLEENNLREEFIKYGLNEQDITFIKEQIAVPPKESEVEWSGRGKKKWFLYEIVANKRNGIDVDKWDYFARDCHGLGIKNNFDHLRYMKFSRVLNVDGSLQICSRVKEADTLYSMFQTRATLHRRAYQHRVCNAIEIMITDALLEANEKPIVLGKDGNLVKISDCIDDPVAFTNLNDSIVHSILMTTDEDLAKSRAILNRVYQRKLYKCVGETTPTQNKTNNDIEEIRQGIVSNIPEDSRDILGEHDIVVHLVYLDYGMKTQNPIKNVKFYNKNDVTKPISLDEQHVSLMLPKVFAEQLIRLYCKKTDEESIRIATQCFQKWCDAKGMLAKQDSLTPDKRSDLVTPVKDDTTAVNKTTPVSAGKFKQRLSF